MGGTTKGPPGRRDQKGVEGREKVVPPERVELSSPAPEAGTLSTELQGQVIRRIACLPRGQQADADLSVLRPPAGFAVDKPHAHH